MKTYRLIIILLVVIIALPVSGRIFWMIKRVKPINIIIINKSVQESSRNEVKTLCWTLNYQKIFKKSREPYDFNLDYFGYFPDAIYSQRRIKSFKLEEISSISDENDALFFIDNFGVKLSQQDKKSTRINNFGGFNQNDYFLLKEMINRKKLVVAEYNFFSAPTEDLVRYNTEHFLDVYSLGWIGKYFDDLSKSKLSNEISAQWFDTFSKIYSFDWEFSGPGIILFNSRENRILVVPAKKYMNSKYPSIVTSSENTKEFNIPQKVFYSGWFEIDYEGKNKIISSFDLNLNEEGIDLFRKNGIGSVFPAVIQSVNKRFYYFSGDFSKVKVIMPFSRLGFISNLIIHSGNPSNENPNSFFKVYYNNLLSTILNDYYSDISKIGK
jgi:hypothetical protein